MIDPVLNPHGGASAEEFGTPSSPPEADAPPSDHQPDLSDHTTVSSGANPPGDTVDDQTVAGDASTPESAAARDRRDERIVRARADGHSYPKCAVLANCSERTVRRVVSDPEVRRRIDCRRTEILDEADGRFSSLTAKAVDTISDVLESDRPTDRLNAAKLILSGAAAAQQRRELEELSELEQQLADLAERLALRKEEQ